MHATTTSQEGVVVVNGLRTFGKLHKREKGEKGEKRIHNSIIGNSVLCFVLCFVLCVVLFLFCFVFCFVFVF